MGPLWKLLTQSERIALEIHRLIRPKKKKKEIGRAAEQWLQLEII